MESSSHLNFCPAPQLEISAGDSDNLITVTLSNEDHTLGNSLRWILMKKFALPFRFLLIEVKIIQLLIHLFLAISPEVDFCGYSVPHPSEPKMNVRIQTKDGTCPRTPARVLISFVVVRVLMVCVLFGAGKPSVEALRKGLNDLVSIAEYTLGTFQSEFQMFVDSNGITEDGSEASEMEE